MMRSLFSAVSGLKNHQTAMDVIGNNVANVNTTAYKSKKAVFQDIISQTVSSATAPTTTAGGMNAKQIGLGMGISTIATDITGGSAQTTDKPLDFSIEGEGYFVVGTGATGSMTYTYTRNGNFTTDADGYLVTANGDYVMAVNGTAVANTDSAATFDKIQISGGTNNYSEYTIDSSGVVKAKNGTTQAVDTVGRLVLATFNNAAGLENIGSSRMQESSNSGTAAINFVNYNCGKVQSGQLEMSNVQLASELTNMIIMQRGFQSNSRVITTSDTMLEELINLKR